MKYDRRVRAHRFKAHRVRAARLVGLLSALSLCSCAHNGVRDGDLLFREGAPLDPVADLTALQIERDLALLDYALDHAYGGRRFVPPKALDEARARLHRIRRGSAAFGSRDLCHEVDLALLLLPDNHLMANAGGSLCSDERRALLAEGRVGRNLGAGSDRPWTLVTRAVAGAAVPVLSITRLPPAQDDAWAGFEEEVTRLVASSPALVLDIRGNGGGADSMMNRLARQLYGHEAPGTVESRTIRQTPATFALQVNQNAVQVVRRRQQGEEPPSWLRDHLRGAEQDYARAVRGELPPERVVTDEEQRLPDASHGYDRPIYVLVDHGCASSCESIVELLRAHPRVTFVGENTGGFVHFGNLGLLVLPGSRVFVQIPSDYWRLRGGRYVERVGYAPDVRVAPGKDALEVVLRVFEESQRRPTP